MFLNLSDDDYFMQDKRTALMIACEFGHMPVVKYLLENANLDAKHINQRDKVNSFFSCNFQFICDYFLTIGILVWKTSTTCSILCKSISSRSIFTYIQDD